MQGIASVWLWIGFCLFVIFALSVDTFFIDRRKNLRPRSVKASLYWTAAWISCAFIFAAFLWFYLNQTATRALANQKTLEFVTGYLIEESLSIDNLFVFFLIFHQFRIPAVNQRHVFSYGIWSAIVFRLVLILLGTWLVAKVDWVLYIFGAFLLLTGVKIFFFEREEKDLASGFIFRWLKKHIRITDTLHGDSFFIRQNGLLYATPLLLALIFIEIGDLIFALDSIPAIFAITLDPFIVWTSNIFAILGLRALYFSLAHMVDRFRLLKYGIATILIFVGIKMLIAHWLKIPIIFSLGFIIGILGSFILISLLLPVKEKH